MTEDRERLRVRDFHLGTGKRLLWRGEDPLTQRVFGTLLYLVEHHECVLDNEMLMEAIWLDSIVEELGLRLPVEVGREEKLRRITGHILRENTGMLRVARQSGFQVRETDDGRFAAIEL